MSRNKPKNNNQQRRKHPNRSAQQDKTGRGKVKHLKNDSNFGGGKVQKEFHKPNRPDIQPLNAKQEHYFHMLDNPQDFNIILVEGIFGTGKTYCASAVAADSLLDKLIDKVVVSRPYVQTGKTSGFKPGTSLEKMYPYVRNVLDTMKQRMGTAVFEYNLKDGLKGNIEVQELENIRGRSFDEPCMLIIDEAQQTTPEEMLSIVTRISDNCTLVLCGDDSQRDISGQSGLAWFKAFAQRHQLEGVGYVNFDSPDDIVRGGLCGAIARGLAYDEANKNG